MKSLFVTAAAAATLALAMPLTATAQERSVELSFNASATSDYVWRGFSQSNTNPAIQGGVDLTYGGFYAGTWASSVDFEDSTDAEWDFYAGYTGTAGAIDWDLGVTYYTYVDAPSGSDYNFVEFKAAASYAIDDFTLGASVNYSPDFYGTSDKNATYIEATAEYQATENLAISGGFGRQYLDKGQDYNAWNLGASVNLNEAIALDIRYWDSSVSSNLSDKRVSVTLGLAI